MSQFSIDPAQGAAFGLALSNVGGAVRLAAVEDVTNSVDVWTFNSGSRPRYTGRSWASGIDLSTTRSVATLPVRRHPVTGKSALMNRPFLNLSGGSGTTGGKTAATHQSTSVKHESDTAFARLLRRSAR